MAGTGEAGRLVLLPFLSGRRGRKKQAGKQGRAGARQGQGRGRDRARQVGTQAGGLASRQTGASTPKTCAVPSLSSLALSCTPPNSFSTEKEGETGDCPPFPASSQTSKQADTREQDNAIRRPTPPCPSLALFPLLSVSLSVETEGLKGQRQGAGRGWAGVEAGRLVLSLLCLEGEARRIMQAGRQARRQARAGQCHSPPRPSQPFPCPMYLSLSLSLSSFPSRQQERGSGQAQGAGQGGKVGRLVLPTSPPPQPIGSLWLDRQERGTGRQASKQASRQAKARQCHPLPPPLPFPCSPFLSLSLSLERGREREREGEKRRERGIEQSQKSYMVSGSLYS